MSVSSSGAAAWSRRDVCIFTKGILVLSKRVCCESTTLTKSTMRAFFTWRLASRTTAARTPSRETEASAEDQESRGRSRAVLRLNALYLQQLGDGEKVREELRERREVSENSTAFSASIPLTYAKRFIIVQMSARIKRCLRLSFDRWKVFLQNTLDKMRLAHRMKPTLVRIEHP